MARGLAISLEELQAEAKKNKVLTKRNGKFVDEISVLTERQQKLALLLLTRPDLSDIDKVRMAGFNVKGDAKATSFVAKVEGKLGDVLLELKITQGEVGKVIVEQLSAMTTHVFREPVYSREGKKTGMKTVLVEVPDNGARVKMVNTLLKLGNYFPAAKLKVEQKITHSVDESIDVLKQRIRKAESTQIPADYEEVNTDFEESNAD